jgi:SAM-dependent methyltransferase
MQPDNRAQRWQLSATAALEYERWLVPVLFRPWALDLVARAAPAAGSRVLDLACGTGVVARAVAEALPPPAEVIGVDRSMPMLDVAESVSGSSQAAHSWWCCSADALPFPETAVDTIFCQQGFQFFTDPGKVAEECARVLKRGGKLAASVWAGADRNPIGSSIIGGLRAHAPEAIAAAMEAPFGLADVSQLAEMLTDAGFQVESVDDRCLRLHAPDTGAFFRGMLNAAPFAADLHTVDVDAVVRDVRAALSGYAAGEGFEAPSVAWTIVATRV